MDKESREEACAVLAQEYMDLAHGTGFKEDEVYTHYFDRCMTRKDKELAEQAVRAGDNTFKLTQGLTWLEAWEEERKGRMKTYFALNNSRNFI